MDFSGKGSNVTALRFAFLHFYHLDKANATIHCADVRFSPITFELCKLLPNNEVFQEKTEVENHLGKYEVDGGR